MKPIELGQKGQEMFLSLRNQIRGLQDAIIRQAEVIIEAHGHKDATDWQLSGDCKLLIPPPEPKKNDEIKKRR